MTLGTVPGSPFQIEAVRQIIPFVLLFRHEDGTTTFLHHIIVYVPNYTASYSRWWLP